MECFTFQRGEVSAPFFAIQPMLRILFQKVLSLANGPCSHRDPQRERSQQEGRKEVVGVGGGGVPECTENKKEGRKKEREEGGDLGDEC